jgi:hypothetical protein
MNLDAETLKLLLLLIGVLGSFGTLAGVWAVLRADIANLKTQKSVLTEDVANLRAELSSFQVNAAKEYVTYHSLAEVKTELLIEMRLLGSRIDKALDAILRRT